MDIQNLEKNIKAGVGEVREWGGRKWQKMGDGSWKPVVNPQHEQQKKEDDKVVSLNAKLQEKQASNIQKYVETFKNHKIFEGRQLKSGKPVFTNVEDSISHGYSHEDFREAGNIYYDHAQKLADKTAKLQEMKLKVDPAIGKLKDMMSKMARQNFSQAERVDRMKREVSVALKTPKDPLKKPIKKAVVMMGQADAREVDTSKYSLENRNTNDSGLLSSFISKMEGYNYGDLPREIGLDKGMLYLVKVDDGLYSGVVKAMEPKENPITGLMEMIEDTARVRIERMTMPELINFLMAKEYIKPVQTSSIEVLNAKLNEVGDAVTNLVEQKIVEESKESQLDRKIRILELVDKLIN